MLVHLSIHNYAIVEHLDLEIARGMSVITGETGAGKSIMLDALGLALGDRADSGVVRPGTDKADILATFDLVDIPEAHAWLAERDLDNDGLCILRRVITAEGRSRGYINGTPCPLGDLKALGEAANMIASAQIQVEEAMGELNRFLDNFDADPMRLQALEERLDTIYTLARKHRVHPTELPHLQQQLMDELEGLNASDESIERLGEELGAFAQHYKEKALELSALRQQAAKQLAVAVEQEIQRLGMPGGRFCIELTPNEGNDLSPHGLEQIELLVSANPGQPLKGLAKVASGGELSRISLAIQVITAQTSRIPTLVFDEVDVGIGGPTAEIVGQLLRRLGERGQVLTVTHLPQVAAQGHHHLFVHKVRNSDTTHTAVASLGKRERVEEVARMLGGIDLTKESLAHARKMVVSGKA